MSTLNHNKMYTLQRNNKTLSTYHQNMHYIIGFKKVTLARKVHYNIHPEPKVLIVRNTNYNTDTVPFDLALSIDTTAELLIPKAPVEKVPEDGVRGLRDIDFHLAHFDEDYFLSFPVSKNLGIVLASDVYEETEEEFIFKAMVIDPIMIYNMEQ